MNNEMNQFTSKDNTYQYTCQAVVDHKTGAICGLKYSVGEVIVTGTLNRDQLGMRNGRRPGHCHCGAQFSTEFGCTKNVMWSLKVDGQEQEFFPRRTLTRIPGPSVDSRISPQFLALKQKMGTDPEFAESVRAIQRKYAERKLNSNDRKVIEEEAQRLSESHCDELLSRPGSSEMPWFDHVLSRKNTLLARRTRDKPGTVISHVREVFSHSARIGVEASA